MHRKTRPYLRPAQIKYMDQLLKEDGIIDEDSECFPLVVITNSLRIDDAISITFQDTRERLRAMLKDDVYILPSSIHECLAIAKNNADPRDLYQMVCNVGRRKGFSCRRRTEIYVRRLSGIRFAHSLKFVSVRCILMKLPL